MATTKTKKAKAPSVSVPAPVSANNDIEVVGARTHNLQNVTVTFPRNQLIVVTGVSGSGKSSLTIDTLFAEGQRRYAESLSAYARQFMSRMAKPDVDYIRGLCPAIAIEQKVITRTPRSTVGSMTEIYDYLRLLFARIGHTISPVSGREVKKDEVNDVVGFIRTLSEGLRLYILVPFTLHGQRQVREELGILSQKGFSRMAILDKGKLQPHRLEDLLEEGKEAELETLIPLKRVQDKDSGVFVLVDRLVTKDSVDEEEEHRLTDSVGLAMYEGYGELLLMTEEAGKSLKSHPFSNRFELDGIQFEEPVPNLFSFNNPFGACPTCEGFGQVLGIDPDLVLPNPSLSVYEYGVAPWKGDKLGWWREQFLRGAGKLDFPVHKPIGDLSKEELQTLWKGKSGVYGINDFFKEVEANLYKVQYRVLLSRYRGRTLCPDCEGYRLRKEALYVKIGGRHIGELCELPVRDLQRWFRDLQLSDYDAEVGRRLLVEIHQRLDTLVEVGLGYLTLNRLANSLSGGESQRIQLTRSLGSNLTNSLYILDEPSIGLHSRDTDRLINVLHNLKKLGNTVVVVEHDEMMMRRADHVIDMGPLASHLGGRVVAAGDYAAIIGSPESLTGQYLRGDLKIERKDKPRKWTKSLMVEGARQNNLKGIDVSFPLEIFTVVTGVSGSGKTTLVKQILYPALKKRMGEPTEKVGLHKAITGDFDAFKQVELIDQNPIGKSSRSNPVTYIKAWDAVRELYADQPLAKMRGFQTKHFSFNTDGGRCDACKGEGEQVVEMQFLADVHLTCEVCQGKRFKEEVLEVTFKGKSVFDVLEMSVDEAIAFFSEGPATGKGKKPEGQSIATALQPLSDVGLGYVKLGQSSDTLSGGEAQRVKLASFLGKGQTSGKVLFIFDEPTTGLHFHDIQKLLQSFQALVALGHSLIVIEHNTDLIRCADWVIDLGPEAGDGGGSLVYAGLPEGLKKVKESYTGQYL